MKNCNPFTLELLQAINDWQRYSTSARGEKLYKLCANLPPNFKTVTSPCFRKINLEKGGIFSLFSRNKLDEKISSWSTSESIVREFKGGVSKRHLIEQSIILKFSPQPYEVIINLSEVYNSTEFKEALYNHSDKIKNIDKGINKYNNSQSEVVINLEYVNSDNVHMVGGRSAGVCISKLDKLKRPPNSQIFYNIDKNEVHVFKWLSEYKTKNLIKRMKKYKRYPFNVLSKNFGFKKKEAEKELKIKLTPRNHGIIFKYSFDIDLYSLYFRLLENNHKKNIKYFSSDFKAIS